MLLTSEIDHSCHTCKAGNYAAQARYIVFCKICSSGHPRPSMHHCIRTEPAAPAVSGGPKCHKPCEAQCQPLSGYDTHIMYARALLPVIDFWVGEVRALEGRVAAIENFRRQASCKGARALLFVLISRTETGTSLTQQKPAGREERLPAGVAPGFARQL